MSWKGLTARRNYIAGVLRKARSRTETQAETEVEAWAAGGHAIANENRWTCGTANVNMDRKTNDGE